MRLPWMFICKSCGGKKNSNPPKGDASLIQFSCECGAKDWQNAGKGVVWAKERKP